MATVGVVIPAYNAEPWLRDCLQSLQLQTHADWQCVIVNDGSTDGTLALAEGLAAADNRVRVVSQPNTGISGARNTGLGALSGSAAELVMFFDCDDLLLPDAMETLAASLQSRPDAVGAFGVAEFMDEAGRPVRAGVHPAKQRHRRITKGIRFRAIAPGEDSTFADMALYGPIWPPAVGIHRLAQARALHGFDPSIRFVEDWDFYLRMSRNGPYAMVDRQVAWYRRHSSNISNDAVGAGAHQRALMRKTWFDPANSAEQRHILAVGYRRLRIEEAYWTARVALGEVKRRQWRGAARAAVASVWRAGLLGHPSPPTPRPRLEAWALGVSTKRNQRVAATQSPPLGFDPVLGG